MEGYLIHPSIPQDAILSIADIGCGTGVWLEEVAKVLPDSADSKKRTYYGFDISMAMFPPDSERGNIKYAKMDILDPVPEEYHARFDLVSIRFLCVAVKAAALGQALRNAEQMISQFKTQSISCLY